MEQQRCYKVTQVEILAVVLFFAVALFLRVYRLDSIPPGLHNDEAANGLDARAILAGHTPIFFERNYGREPLFIYLQAGMIWVLGETPLALRLTAALVGALVIPATYWMVRELFAQTDQDPRQIATWATLFLTFGYWHLGFSRLGFRANLLPLVAAITFAFFWRAWRHLGDEKPFPWLTLTLAGACLGLSFYTYIAGRFMPFLVLVVAAAGLIQPGQGRRQRWRQVAAVGLIAITSALVFAPLGFFFWQHPDLFLQRAATVSIFGQSHDLGSAVSALMTSVGKTVGMFFYLPDPNIRHNPAARPVFDWVMGSWLAVGMVVALVRWRTLPYLFVASWVVILALPAILTVEGIPHSLRAMGMIPAVYIVPIVAMVEVGRWAARYSRRQIALWLPLPFLIFSGITDIHDYFFAWQDRGRFAGAFFTDYIDLGNRLSQYGNQEDSWVVTLSPNHFPLGTELYTIDFLYRGQSKIIYSSAAAPSAPAILTEQLNGSKQAYLLRPQLAETFPSAAYTLGDPKNLVKFLFDKYAVLTEVVDETVVGMPFLVYALPPYASYQLFNTLSPFDASFAHQVKLIGVDYGRTAGKTNQAVTSRQVPSGQSLWVVLRWVAEAPIAIDLKSSLYLADPAGYRVGQADELLVGDRYPVERVWDADEMTNSYYILKLLPATPPGTYGLFLRVYEDLTLRQYPVVEAENKQGGDFLLANVEITKALEPAPIMPGVALSGSVKFGNELLLRGYDLLQPTVTPGDTLGLTMYWQVVRASTAAYRFQLQLRSGDGQRVLVEESDQPVSARYPTDQWSAQEIVRDWRNFHLPPTLENGSYQIVLVVADEKTTLGELVLGAITIAGRPHRFEALPVQSAVSATFGVDVRLVGLATALPTTLEAGGELTTCIVWQPLRPSPEPLTRFVHLLDATGQVVAQQDGTPCQGQCPASSWAASEFLCDEVTLPLPINLPHGEYHLATGWYSASTLVRLPARDERGNRLPDDLLIFPAKLRTAQ